MGGISFNRWGQGSKKNHGMEGGHPHDPPTIWETLMFKKFVNQSQFALFVTMLKNLTWNQMKKDPMTYYYLNTSCEWAINFHIEPCTYL